MISFSRVSALKVLARMLNIEIEEVTLSEDELKIIEIVEKKKKLRVMIRRNRKIDIVKTKIMLNKAKSFVKRIYDSFGEFSKKAVAIYRVCEIILNIVDQINKLVHKERDEMALF